MQNSKGCGKDSSHYQVNYEFDIKNISKSIPIDHAVWWIVIYFLYIIVFGLLIVYSWAI